MILYDFFIHVYKCEEIQQNNIVEVRFSLEIKSKSEIKILLFSSMTWDVMVDTSSSSSISVLRKGILPKKRRGRIFCIQLKPHCWVRRYCESLNAFIVHIISGEEDWGEILYQALTNTLQPTFKQQIFLIEHFIQGLIYSSWSSRK